MPQASLSSPIPSVPADDLHDPAAADVRIPAAPGRRRDGQDGSANPDIALADTPEAAVNRLIDAAELPPADFDGADAVDDDAVDDDAGRLSWKDALPLLVASAAALWVLIVAIVWTVTAS